VVHAAYQPEIGVFDAPFSTASEIRGGRCAALSALGLLP